MIKIVTVIGARPQFVKAAVVSCSIRSGWSSLLQETIVHTGQHYDENMSQVFFNQLDMPSPTHNLGISGGGHGAMTGRMLEEIEKVLLVERPDWVLVYGDTNSTLAATLAAKKISIKIAHVEAGLRSSNMNMPEEINRIVVDRLSDLLFCPTDIAMANLEKEGISHGVFCVGDVMLDAALHFRDKAEKQSSILGDLDVEAGGYVLATCHRAENTDSPTRLRGIVTAFAEIAENIPLILPLHPRTRGALEKYRMGNLLGNIQAVEPLSCLDMVTVEQSARVILTDSGGIQKEACFYGVPCLTLRDETEWLETVELGWNRIVGSAKEDIISAYKDVTVPNSGIPKVYGSGNATEKILQTMVDYT